VAEEGRGAVRGVMVRRRGGEEGSHAQYKKFARNQMAQSRAAPENAVANARETRAAFRHARRSSESGMPLFAAVRCSVECRNNRRAAAQERSNCSVRAPCSRNARSQIELLFCPRARSPAGRVSSRSRRGMRRRMFVRCCARRCVLANVRRTALKW